VHFDLDPIRTEDLTTAWSRLGLSRLALEVHELPDRRLTRAATELVAAELADGDTEVTVLLPRIRRSRVWHRMLHDRTADSLVGALGALPHCNVTIVPYAMHAGGRDHFAIAPATPTANGHRSASPTPAGIPHIAGSALSPRCRPGVGPSSSAPSSPCACSRGPAPTRWKRRCATTAARSRSRSSVGAPSPASQSARSCGRRRPRPPPESQRVLNPSFTLISVPEHEAHH
jgi:hypothetical protein